MTTVYNKIHRLKQQPGWTWDRFLTEIDKRFPAGLDEKTLYSHYRQPHKKPYRHVTKIINQLHDHCFPDPFPDDINRLMQLYNNLHGCQKHPSKAQDIQHLEYFVSHQLSRESDNEPLRIARFNWLLGNIQFDRIPIYRDNGQKAKLEETQSQAIAYYRNTVAAIERYNDLHNTMAIGVSHLYKARHNMLACYLNAVPQEQRNQATVVLGYLHESNYIINSKQALDAEPFQWSIARNGLRFSALVKNAEDVDYFFSALVRASGHFLNLAYEPLNYGSISTGSDFKWAVEHVLTPAYLEKLQQRHGKNAKERHVNEND